MSWQEYRDYWQRISRQNNIPLRDFPDYKWKFFAEIGAIPIPLPVDTTS